MANYHELVENQRAYVLSGQPASLTHRRNQLLKLRKVLSDEQDTLTEAVFKDLRRQKELTGAIELSGVFLEIDYMLDNMKEWSSPTNVEKTLLTLLDTPQIVRNPKGVVLVVGPWNYPLNTLFVPLVAVLAAGNTAVVKPSEVASHTAQAVDMILSKAFDKQYLAVVQGGITETTELMKEHFDHIMFTSSAPVARFVLEAAAKHLTPCTLELGGKCPVVVEADTDIEVTARRLAWGKCIDFGQTCARYPSLTQEKIVQPSQLTGSRRGIPVWCRSGIEYLVCLLVGVIVGFLVNCFSKGRQKKCYLRNLLFVVSVFFFVPTICGAVVLGNSSCTPLFDCGFANQCINQSKVCDYIIDCQNGFDELNCHMLPELCSAKVPSNGVTWLQIAIYIGLSLLSFIAGKCWDGICHCLYQFMRLCCGYGLEANDANKEDNQEAAAGKNRQQTNA